MKALAVARMAVAGTLVAATVAVAAPAQALPMDRDSRGRCTDGSRWELSLDRERGRVEVDFEIDGPRRADWTATIRHNGNQVHRSTRRADLGGDVEWGITVSAPRGQQHTFQVRATGPNGAVCSARDTI